MLPPSQMALLLLLRCIVQKKEQPLVPQLTDTQRPGCDIGDTLSDGVVAGPSSIQSSGHSLQPFILDMSPELGSSASDENICLQTRGPWLFHFSNINSYSKLTDTFVLFYKNSTFTQLQFQLVGVGK